MLSVSIQKDGLTVLAEKFENITICYKNYEFESSKSLVHCVSEKDFYSMQSVATQMKQLATAKLEKLFRSRKDSASEYVIETKSFGRDLEFRIPEYELQVSDDGNDNRMMIDQQVNIIIMTGIQQTGKDEGKAIVRLYGVLDYHEWCFVLGAAVEIGLQCIESMHRLAKLSKPSGAKS